MTICPLHETVAVICSLGRLAVISGVLWIGVSAAAEAGERPAYPQARRGDQIDVYHGRRIADPYRWLEETDSPETRAWIEAENALTNSFLEKIPQRTAIRARLAELWNYDRFGVPVARSGRYFFTRQRGLQPQPELCVAETPGGEGRVLIDPNKLSEDGTVAFSGWVASPDGRRVAYGLAAAGSDWQVWRVRDVATGQDSPEQLDWIKFSSVSWLPDASGFYYARYPEPNSADSLVAANYFQKLYFHRVGTPQSDDELVYERPDRKDWGFNPTVTDDGRFLVVSVWRGSEEKNLVLYRRLDRGPETPLVGLVSEFTHRFDFLDNDGDRLWFSTDQSAPRGKIVACDLSPDRGEPAWSDVVAESADSLVSASVVGERFILGYLHHAASRVVLHKLDGAPAGELPQAGLVSIGGFTGQRGDKETFYSLTGFATPPEIHRLDLETGKTDLLRRPEVPFDPADYETRQVFVPSGDGTRVPVFLIHKRGLAPNGKLPTYLYAYGGFNVPITPAFSVQNLVWMERGGLLAIANLRGGGEYGRQWHEAGRGANKQNVFDDFAAVARYLVAEGYTSRERLAISGRSNGGLLVGASETQHPELFGACVPGVGVMDMLRFHRFTIGWAWTREYGTPDDADDFETLVRYSPLHNIKPGTAYPATLVLTADHDDRVVPGHSFKFAAALQAAQGGSAPVLIRIETSAGHGAGMPTEKRIDEAADVLAFLTAVLQVD